MPTTRRSEPERGLTVWRLACKAVAIDYSCSGRSSESLGASDYRDFTRDRPNQVGAADRGAR